MSYWRRLLLALSFAAIISILIIGTFKLYENDVPTIVTHLKEKL